MIKEFNCDKTPDCRPFEKRFESYEHFMVTGALCPVCKEPAKVQVSQTARPRFQGSGFYETDYKK